MKRGFSLIEVGIAVVIISIAAYVLMRMFGSHYLAGGRLDRGVKGNQLLTIVGLDVQQMEYGELLAMCKDKSAMGANVTGNCMNGTVLKELSAQTAPAAGKPKLDVRVTMEGNVDALGDSCVELRRCDLKANESMLEVTVRGHWLDAEPTKPVVIKDAKFRRVRW